MRSHSFTFQIGLLAALVIAGCQSAAPLEINADIEEAACKPIVYSYGTFGRDGFEDNIVSVCPDGSEKQRLTVDGLQNGGPSWSPDGRSIAFLSSSSGMRQLHLMDADGNNQRPLTSDADIDFYYSLWMPDGQHVALLTRSGNQPWQWQLIDIETGEMQPFEDWADDLNFHPVAFSHDSTRLVYLAPSETVQRTDGQTRQIHIQNSDGSNDLMLTDSQLDNKNPRWSPDDSQIAFLSELETSNGQYALYIINTDGRQLRRLTDRLFDRNSYFEWSPDGQSFVVFADHSLFTMDANSGEILVELASVPDLAGQGQDSGNGLNLERMGGGLSWQP